MSSLVCDHDRMVTAAVTTSARAARAWFVGCAIAAVVAGVILAGLRSWMCDDAFITFRYADNLVRGHGLVFNAGERVEGYTNFSWTLWTALDRVPDLVREAPFHARLGLN
jgi:hypothetical protein